MSFGGYDAFEDPYSYKDSICLKNRLGIRDPEVLQNFELEMSTLRSEEPLPSGKFSPTHYCRIHHHLFQDVYTWAGRYRTIRTAKGGNPFCYPENINAEMKKLFARLHQADLLPGTPPDAFTSAAADFLADLNAIHPFREGNGRSQLSFLHILAVRAGHPLALERVQRETFIPAMIESFAGNLAPLVAELTTLRA